jgi:hypothetical protein
MPGEGSLLPSSTPAASQNANFYSIQINGFLQARILQLAQNKALHFFYSIQMNGRESLLANHESLLTDH